MAQKVTEKEFLRSIIDLSKGRPIDVARYPTIDIDRQWTQEDYRYLRYSSDDDKIAIGIHRLDKFNPPKSIVHISFTERNRHIKFIEEIPVIVSNDALSKLIFRRPIRKVKFPHSAKEALYKFRDEPTGYEWGGGIDFEIVKGKAHIERILSYFGEKGRMTFRAVKKYGSDVEVAFHTHPDAKLAVPSKDDIVYIITSKQQVQLIISHDQILIIEKTKRTPKLVTLSEVMARTPEIGYVAYTLEEQKRDLAIISKEYKLKMRIVPYSEDIELDLKIIREMTS